jgi:Gpi18-like mannosyltransferase
VRRRGVIFAALLLGLIVRVAALALPGTEDVRTWKIWAFGASRNVTHVYGVGGHPPERGVLTWNSLETTVDYPPAALYELGVVGLVYRQLDPAFRDSSLLTAAIKVPGLLCGIALTGLLTWSARRFSGDDRAASWIALAYWLNPATILDGEVLGYLDPLMMLPGIGALVLIHAGAMESAGLALSLAVLTKPQGIFLLPGCGLAAWHKAGVRGLARVAAGGALGGTLLVLPFALVGALPNMWLAFGSFYARRDILSGNAANVWWIVNYVVRAYYQIPRLGFPHAYLVEVRRIMAVSTLQEAGFPNPRPFAAAAVLSTSAWGLWRLRRRPDLAAHALASALVVHAFFVLGIGVHEHHMMLMVPLLALAAALQPALRPLFYVVSAIVALNMNLFYGIGMGRGWSVPRLLLGIDLSVLLSIANVVALVWHGRIVMELTRSRDP